MDDCTLTEADTWNPRMQFDGWKLTAGTGIPLFCSQGFDLKDEAPSSQMVLQYSLSDRTECFSDYQ